MAGPGSDVYTYVYHGRNRRVCRPCARIRDGSLPYAKRYPMSEERKRIKQIMSTVSALRKAADGAPVTLFGRAQTESEWCDEFGITVANLHNKLKRGRTYEEALTFRKGSKNSCPLYCKRGHMRITANSYVSPSGRRQCRPCHEVHHQQNFVPAPPRTHCRNGHDYSIVGTYLSKGGRRRCRECTRIRKAKKSASKGRQPTNAVKTHCKRGHPFSKDNTWFNPKAGTRRCRECHRNSNRKVGK